MRNKHNPNIPYRIDLLIRVLRFLRYRVTEKISDRLGSWAWDLEEKHCKCRNCKRRAVEDLLAKKA